MASDRNGHAAALAGGAAFAHGPKMAELSPREQRFVLAMLADPFGNATAWVKQAGYACHDGAKVTGHRVLKRARVEAAVFEVARSLLDHEGPLVAVAGLLQIARDEKHPKRLRALETLANRIGLHEITQHTVRVERREESAEAKAERIRLLAVMLGVDVAQLLGANLVKDISPEAKPGPKAIEHAPLAHKHRAEERRDD